MQDLLLTWLLIECVLPIAAALNVAFNTTKKLYYVGDNVTITCYVNSPWLTVSFRRNDSDICDCYSMLKGCIPARNACENREHYDPMIDDSYPTLVINNVTQDDNEVNFTCQWTSFTDTTSFMVQDSSFIEDIATSTVSFKSGGGNNLTLWIGIGIVCVAVISCGIYAYLKYCYSEGSVRTADTQYAAIQEQTVAPRPGSSSIDSCHVSGIDENVKVAMHSQISNNKTIGQESHSCALSYDTDVSDNDNCRPDYESATFANNEHISDLQEEHEPDTLDTTKEHNSPKYADSSTSGTPMQHESLII